MRSFFFLRHGETDWNLANRMQGQIQDIPLNETGIKQAENAAAFLTRHALDLIISSTLDRAVMTAQIIAEKTGLPIVLDQRLIERNLGAAEGMTLAEVDATYPGTFFTHDRDPQEASNSRQPDGCETREDLAKRASSTIFDLLTQYAGQRIVIVTHGAWLRALVRRLTGVDRGFINAEPFIAEEAAEGWQISPLD